MEYFKDIPGYEGLYQASNHGRILALPRKVKNRFSYKITEHCFLKPIDCRGYSQTRLYKNGKGKTFKFHKLIMMAFRGKSDLEINHIDGNKKNNNLSNLEYCTRSQNIKHAFDNGLMNSPTGSHHGRSIFTEKEVIEIWHDNRPHSQIAKDFKCSRAAIWNIKNKKCWEWLTGEL